MDRALVWTLLGVLGLTGLIVISSEQNAMPTPLRGLDARVFRNQELLSSMLIQMETEYDMLEDRIAKAEAVFLTQGAEIEAIRALAEN
jgi:hypothetical protein